MQLVGVEAVIIVMLLAAVPFLLSSRLGRVLGFGVVAAGVAVFLASSSGTESAMHEVFGWAGWAVNRGVR
jgi:hypothetical protein